MKTPEHAATVLFLALAMAGIPAIPQSVAQNSPMTPSAATPASSRFSLELQPLLSLPLGRDSDVFSLGGGASILGRYGFPKLPFLALEGGGAFGLVPVQVAPGKSISSATMNLFWPWAGVALGFAPLPWMRLEARGSAGYFFAGVDASLANSSGSNPMYAAGLDLDFRLSKSLSVGLGAEYRDFLGLYNDLALRLGTTYHFQPLRGQGGAKYRPYTDLVIEKIELDPMFPVLFKYYGDHPVGSVLVKNRGKIPIENLKLQFYVNQYMDNPTISAEVPFLKGGQELKLDAVALFNDKVLGISEATKVQADVVVIVNVAGDSYGSERVETLRMYDRNAITWTDDRRVAAFVSSKDPDVMRFAKNVASAIKGRGPLAFSDALLDAVALHAALASYGLSYQTDPSTPYTQFSKDATAIDYLQFPGQSLQFKAGDCDDLSILNASLLEALGVQTAFITVPGHIYIAFDSGLTPADLGRRGQSSADYIIVDQTAWVPVEITMTKEDFLKAWDTGVEEWRLAGNAAHLYPVHDAWKLYEPVGFAGAAAVIAPPPDTVIVDGFRRSMKQIVDRELGPQETALKNKVQGSQGDPKLLNSLGVLYARYGYPDKAEAQFSAILSKREYFPALINIANLRYLGGQMAAARDLYLRATKAQSGSALATLGLARASFELADYAASARYYAQLKAQSPDLAATYSYLAAGSAADAATRASDADALRNLMQWSEQ